MTKRTHLLRRLSPPASLVLVTVLAATGCSGTSAEESGSTGEEPVRIVYFASATGNGFSNAVWEGMQAGAEELGGEVELRILDGQFNPTTQFTQLQDATSSGQYDGAVLLANDTVGSAPAVEALIESGVVVSNVLNPLGPDLESLEQQVPGLLSVIADPSFDTTLQAEEVVAYCEGKATCRVVILIGGRQYPFDSARLNAYLRVLDGEPNIEVVATGEANYDRDQAVTAMGDILQANPDFDVLLSATDQQTLGAQVALEQAGYDLEARIADGSFYINSLGGAQDGVAAVRAGQWNATVGNFPETAGRLAVEQVIQSIRGEEVTEIINLDEAAPVPLLLTPEVLAENPDFIGEWSG